MAHVRSTGEKSSDWSRSSKGGQGEAASTQGNMAQAASVNDKSSDKSRSGSQAPNQLKAASNFTANALRGLGQIYDMQAATMRAMLRTQTRAASAFGLPDYSRLFEIGDDRALHLYSSVTENLVSFVNQADGSLTEIPSQICRLLEQQAIDITERWKYGLEELQQQASESMQELKELSRQQAEELARASESLTTATQSTLREGGEQFRAAVSHGRELAGRQSEGMRKEGESFAGDVQESIKEGGQAAEEGAENLRSRHSRAA